MVGVGSDEELDTDLKAAKDWTGVNGDAFLGLA